MKLLTEQLKHKTILTQGNYLTQDLPYLKDKTMTTLKRLKTPLVESAALELTPIPLHQQIINLAQKSQDNDYQKIDILPLFLTAGVHVKKDIPAEIAAAKKVIGKPTTIKLSPYLGKYSGMPSLLAHKFAQLSDESRILMAHGSRLPEVNRQCMTLATKLDAVVAYWATSPSLRTQVEAQIAAGKKKIAILPYFLFPGRIVTAIAEQVVRLRATFPEAELILGQPLGATAELATLILEEV